MIILLLKPEANWNRQAPRRTGPCIKRFYSFSRQNCNLFKKETGFAKPIRKGKGTLYYFFITFVLHIYFITVVHEAALLVFPQTAAQGAIL